jgi:hypothetical protein
LSFGKNIKFFFVPFSERKGYIAENIKGKGWGVGVDRISIQYPYYIHTPSPSGYVNIY